MLNPKLGSGCDSSQSQRKKHEAWRKQPKYPPQTLSRLSFQVDTYSSIATQEFQCLVNRSFTLHLSLSECLSVFQSCILFIFFRQTFSHFKPLLVQCWKEMCVFVCISPTWLCRKTVWMRSQHAADRQHQQCKGLSWLSPLARPCCFHAERGSDWGVVASAGQQMFSSLTEAGMDWETSSGGPTRMTNLIPWMRAHNLLNRLDAARTDFVTERSKSKFCVLRHERKACWLAYRRTNSNQSFSSIASVCSLIWTEAVVITKAATCGRLSLTCVRLSPG